MPGDLGPHCNRIPCFSGSPLSLRLGGSPTMEKSFLVLDSLGNYSAAPEGLLKNESVREPGVCPKIKRECKVPQNSGYELFNPDLSDATPDVIVKVEPEEDPCTWGAELRRQRDIQRTTSRGFSTFRWRENARLRMIQREGIPLQERERQRNFKFSEEENDVLIKKISENYEKILGKLTPRTSTSEKKAIWRDIAACVNSVSVYSRTPMQCKKRYADIKKKVKEKMAKQARYQGGRGSGPVSFWPYEKRVMSLISSKAGLGLPKIADSGHVSDEDHGLNVSNLRPSWLDVGNSSSSALPPPLTEHHGREESLEMAEDSSLGVAEKDVSLSDGTVEQDSPESDHNVDCSQGDPTPSAPSLSSVSDHSQQSLFERSLHKKLNYLSTCIKAQTMVLRQTNSILQNLSSNLQTGFQQLVNVIQQAVTVMSPDHQLAPQSTSPTAAATAPDTRMRSVPARNVRGRMSRGQCPYISSPPAKKSR
ncbi:nuclear apoptosis-inducing factor 1-like [Spea bombifrons]|uniref:nuclear apoptosis-inducing factor 1-like n=1 Tax=Spea bombifrons TaxID=233779 RepID=UPI0023498C81|nr:nuclear apoptosis-inducing factor 1-like [Spea bombifrons]